MSDNINITLPDSSVKQVAKGASSADIAKSIGEGLLRASIAAKVDGKLVDLNLPISSDAHVEILTNKNKESHEILLHSCAHLLAQAIKLLYPDAKIAIGPALEDRFYYDIDVDIAINEDELLKIENKMIELSKADAKIKRMELNHSEALKKFSKSCFLHLIN